MIDVLLDTNIVIYLAKKQEKYLRFLQTLQGKRIGISVVTLMEVMVGAKEDGEAERLSAIFSRMDVLPLEKSIAVASVATLRRRRQKSLRDPRFADTIIAHTAQSLGVPLVTNNPRDFATFKGLELLVP